MCKNAAEQFKVKIFDFQKLHCKLLVILKHMKIPRHLSVAFFSTCTTFGFRFKYLQKNVYH